MHIETGSSNMIMSKLERLDVDARDLLRGVSLSLFLRVIAAAAAFTFNLMLARSFGAEGAGIYAMALTTINIGLVAALLGFDTAVIKYIAIHHAKEDQGRVRGVAMVAGGVVLASSTVVALIVYIFRFDIAHYAFNNSEVGFALTIILFALVPLAFVKLIAAGLKALRQIAAAHVLDGLIVPCCAIVGLSLLPVEGIERAVTSYVLGVFIAFAFSAITVIRVLKGFTPATPLKQELRRLLKVGLPSAGIAAGVQLTEWSCILSLAFFASTADVGVFRVSWQLTFLLTIIAMANDSIISPKISALFHTNTIDQLAKTLAFDVRLLILFTAPPMGLLFFAPDMILGFFGEEFLSAVVVLRVLLLGQLVRLGTGPAGRVLLLTGHERASLLNSLFGSLLCFALCFMLVPSYGILGAAIAAASTIAIRCIIAACLVYRYLGFVILFGGIRKRRDT